jgi:hypothetical protein
VWPTAILGAGILAFITSLLVAARIRRRAPPPSKTEPDKTEPDKTEPDKTEPNKTEPEA